jgi:hypothetical protein
MWKRKLYYYLRYGWRRFLFWPLNQSVEWLYHTATLDVYEGIRIVGFEAKRVDQSVFWEATRAALELIRREDPRRFRKIQREIKYIINEPASLTALYVRTYHSCLIPFSKFEFDMESEDAEWYIAYYAAVIVHEATHGHLHSLGFPYAKANRDRIEQICCDEEQRFAARLKSERYDFARDLVRPFNVADWEPYWNRSFWQEVKRSVPIIMRGERDGKDKS